MVNVIKSFQTWILSVAGVVAAALGIYAYGRHRGSEDTEIEMERADNANARKVEDAADRVRRNDGGGASPVERLRKYKRLRDVSDDL